MHSLDDLVALVRAAIEAEGWSAITKRAGVSRDTINRFRSAASLLATKPKPATIRKVAAACDPDPETAPRRWQEVIADAETEDAAPPPAAERANPYRGLLPYEVDDAPVFFGRKHDVEVLVRWVLQGLDEGRERVISIEGPTGAGKTSLLAAGLVATLRQRHGIQAAIVPRMEPEHAVPAAALSAIEDALKEAKLGPPEFRSVDDLVTFLGDRRILLGVDELDAYLTDKLRHLPLLRLLATLHDRCPGLCLAFTLTPSLDEGGIEPELPLPVRRANRRRYPLENLSPVFVTEVIEQPFRRHGVPITEREVSTLVDRALALCDLGGPSSERQPASPLPLLAFVLRQVFEDRSRLQPAESPTHDSKEPFEAGGASADASEPKPASSADEVTFLDEETLDLETFIDRLADRVFSGVVPTERAASVRRSLFASLLEVRDTVGSAGGSAPCALRTMPEPRYGELRILLEALCEKGLVRPVSNGYRFTHLAVPRAWRSCRRWLDDDGERGGGRAFLSMVARFEQRVLALAEAGTTPEPEHFRGAVADGATDEAVIDTAAEVLGTYLPWWFADPPGGALRPLLGACVELIGYADDLRRPVPRSPLRSRLIHFAAYYGARSLLARVSAMTDPVERAELVNLARPDGQTPLICALWQEDNAVVRLLVEAGADIRHVAQGSAKGGDMTPMSLAAFVGIEAHLDYLFVKLTEEEDRVARRLDNGLADPRVAHVCAGQGRLRLLEKLVERTPELVTATRHGSTLLQTAAVANRADVVTLLLERGGAAVVAAERDSLEQYGGGAFHAAVRGNSPQAIRALADGVTALDAAALASGSPTLTELVNATDRLGSTPLILAAATHRVEALEALLGLPEVDVSRRTKLGYGALHLAIEPSLLYSSFTADGESPREILRRDQQSLATIQALLRQPGIDPFELSTPGSNDKTQRRPAESPLSLTLAHPLLRAHLLSYILKDRARFAVLDRPCNDRGDTILHFLAETGESRSRVEEALARTEATRPRNADGRLPIEIALGHGHVETAAALLQAHPEEERTEVYLKALLDSRDASGRTALHRACLRDVASERDEIERLSGHDASIWETEDRYGRRPAELAPSHVTSDGSEATRPIDGLWAPERPGWVDARPGEGALSAIDEAALIASLGDAMDDGDLAGCTLQWRELPFYGNGVGLLRVEPPSGEPSRLAGTLVQRVAYRFVVGDQLTSLTGESDPIHAVNKESFWLRDRDVAGMSGCRDELIEYLRFFCFFVHGREGPFSITERLEQWELGSERIGQRQRRRMLPFLHPVTELTPKDGDPPAGMILSALVWYGRSLFECEFEIAPSGMVAMLADVEVVSDAVRGLRVTLV